MLDPMLGPNCSVLHRNEFSHQNHPLSIILISSWVRLNLEGCILILKKKRKKKKKLLWLLRGDCVMLMYHVPWFMEVSIVILLSFTHFLGFCFLFFLSSLSKVVMIFQDCWLCQLGDISKSCFCWCKLLIAYTSIFIHIGSGIYYQSTFKSEEVCSLINGEGT